MDIKTHIINSWQDLTGNLPPLVVLSLCFWGVTFGLLSPVAYAGLQDSAIQLRRHGREPNPMDVFGQLRLFFPLLGFSILFMILVSIGMLLLVLPGLVILLAVPFFCLFMTLLMTDQQLGLFEAVKTSVSMIVGNVAEYFLVYLVFSVLVWVGTATVLGSLFLLPFAVLFQLQFMKPPKRNAGPVVERRNFLFRHSGKTFRQPYLT